MLLEREKEAEAKLAASELLNKELLDQVQDLQRESEKLYSQKLEVQVMISTFLMKLCEFSL